MELVRKIKKNNEHICNIFEWYFRNHSKQKLVLI